LDAAYGQHHDFQHAVGNRAERVEGNRSANEVPGRAESFCAGRVNGNCWLRKLFGRDGAVQETGYHSNQRAAIVAGGLIETHLRIGLVLVDLRQFDFELIVSGWEFVFDSRACARQSANLAALCQRLPVDHQGLSLF